jgi:hypothetical protein
MITIVILSIIVVLLVMFEIVGIGKESDLEKKNFALKASNYRLNQENTKLKASNEKMKLAWCNMKSVLPFDLEGKISQEKSGETSS